MGHWNHRVVRWVYKDGAEGEEIGYCVHEAFYGLDGDKPSITVEPDYPWGETVEELREVGILSTSKSQHLQTDHSNFPTPTVPLVLLPARTYLDGRVRRSAPVA